MLYSFTASLLTLSFLGVSFVTTASAQPTGSTALARVDGKPINQSDLEFFMLSRGVPKENQAAARSTLLEQLIDRRVMAAFLEGRGIRAKKAAIDAQVEYIERLIRRRKDDPKTVFAKLGYTDKTLRKELELPAAWRQYTTLILTPQRLKTYYTTHKTRFDGTEYRASQIFLKLAADAEPAAVTSAEELLNGLREEVAAGKVVFAEAAKEHSQAPSKNQGGDVGYFPYRGKMPESFTRVAFTLEKDEVGQPFRSQFGLHLITVTDIKPGDLALEDVRSIVVRELTGELWNEIVAREKTKVKIERVPASN